MPSSYKLHHVSEFTRWGPDSWPGPSFFSELSQATWQ